MVVCQLIYLQRRMAGKQIRQMAYAKCHQKAFGNPAGFPKAVIRSSWMIWVVRSIFVDGMFHFTSDEYIGI